MSFWPSDTFDIVTPLSHEDVLTVLQSKVGPRKLFISKTRQIPFQGEFTPNGFLISRVLHYRNSFQPIIAGRFIPDASGVRIAVRMHLHSLVSSVMTLWMVIAGLGNLAVVAGIASGQSGASPAMLIPVALLVFGYALPHLAYRFEAKKQKPMLIEMFGGLESSLL